MRSPTATLVCPEPGVAANTLVLVVFVAGWEGGEGGLAAGLLLAGGGSAVRTATGGRTIRMDGCAAIVAALAAVGAHIPTIDDPASAATNNRVPWALGRMPTGAVLRRHPATRGVVVLLSSASTLQPPVARGRPVDLHLVALMLAHGMHHSTTYNSPSLLAPPKTATTPCSSYSRTVDELFGWGKGGPPLKELWFPWAQVRS